MAYNHEYPYTDNGVNNTDWEINKVKELEKMFNDAVTGGIERAIDAYFNKVMINAIYHEEDEEIELKKELVVGQGAHIYSAGDTSMTIGGCNHV